MKEKILIIDDNKNIVLLLKTFLLQKGYDVSTAYAYCGAMEKMAGEDFDLVITDIDLGEEKTGIDILKEIKKTNPNCPVIVNTASRDNMILSDAKRFGAYDYLLKPLELKELLHSVHKALNLRSISDYNIILKKIDVYRRKNRQNI
ncbi:response regulator [Candidatus Scalindua japonica]|uniref:Response regulator n=1 Tax=Candidatus Scalindua japonica TaxID=1284222 RepID=A0A286TVB6_9BACT|nr:response regulator [Candidatus Scalindua japonica]GAX59828.1 response regulator [Candidatus Scalindua japonica]